jgi:hypothetical protein
MKASRVKLSRVYRLYVFKNKSFTISLFLSIKKDANFLFLVIKNWRIIEIAPIDIYTNRKLRMNILNKRPMPAESPAKKTRLKKNHLKMLKYDF